MAVFLALVGAGRFEVSPFSRCTLPPCPNRKRAAPSAAQSSGNLLSTCPGMLTKNALDVHLQSCFHFPLRVLKTAPSNRDGQLPVVALFTSFLSFREPREQKTQRLRKISGE